MKASNRQRGTLLDLAKDMATKPHRAPETSRPEGGRTQFSSGPASRFVEAAIPQLSLPAILGFAITGFGGALFLAFSTFQSADGIESRRPVGEVPVYSARAVPRDSENAADASKFLSLAQRTGITENSGRQNQKSGEADPADLLSPSASGELRGFNGFAGLNLPNTFLALAAANLTVGMSAQTNPGGHFAPAAETEIVSMVPESSTWMCGLGLTLLVGARYARANWRRSRSRTFRERA